MQTTAGPVYDWLEERGEPRAEYIRAQIALAESGGRLSPEERHRLQQREVALLGRHRRFWNGELHRSLVSAGLRNQVDSRRGLIRSWEYRRGFVESVELHAHALRDFPEVIFRLGPIREFRLCGTPEQIAGVSEWHGEHLQRRGIDSDSCPRRHSPAP